MLRLSLLVVTLLSPIFAHATTVLTSIKPIQLITTELTLGVATPELLVPANASPHDYVLKPSDLKKVKNADISIWYGDGLEPFLEPLLEGKSNVITIEQFQHVDWLEFSSDHHDDGHHHHGNINPHFWLGAKVTGQVAKELTRQLVALDPEHKVQYEQNLVKFEQNLVKTNEAIKQQLTPYKDLGYYVFHDAYDYFETMYQLNHLGEFTVSPERKPGAKTLIAIRKTLLATPGSCVFSEPQFTPAVVKSVTRGTDAKLGVLDPLGSTIENKPGGYFALLQGTANSFYDCFSQ